MARKGDGYKSYKAGDPIHIVVTQDFVEDANRFFTYCRLKGYNPSEIIRQAMVEWMVNQNKVDKKKGSDGELHDVSLDDKLIELIKEKKVGPGRMSLRTVKELLESGTTE
jgi:hypothetical protein